MLLDGLGGVVLPEPFCEGCAGVLRGRFLGLVMVEKGLWKLGLRKEDYCTWKFTPAVHVRGKVRLLATQGGKHAGRWSLGRQPKVDILPRLGANAWSKHDAGLHRARSRNALTYIKGKRVLLMSRLLLGFS